jgi:hypothetical protein
MRARILCCVLLAGCFEEGDAADESGPATGPRSGLWLYTEGDAVDDSCMWADKPMVASGEFDVTNGEDGSFTIIARTDAARLECVLSGEDFTCDPVISDTQVPLLDASIETTNVVSGTLETRERGDGRTDTAVDCDGTQCDGAAAAAGITGFPCSYAVPFTAVFVE